MRTLLAIALMGIICVMCAGCTSFTFEGYGAKLEIKGAPPTLYKIGSYDKDDYSKAFDFFHFESLTAQEELEREPEPAEERVPAPLPEGGDPE